MSHHELPSDSTVLTSSFAVCRPTLAPCRQDRYTELGERESRELMHEERALEASRAWNSVAVAGVATGDNLWLIYG